MGSFRASVFKLGILGIVISLMGVLIWSSLQTPVDGKLVAYSAVIDDVSGLQKGADVRMAGVQVGKVSSIELDGTKALIEFTVKQDEPVYDNTEVSVLFQSLVGQRYLGLVQKPQRGGILPPGSIIPVELTHPSFDISELFDALRPIFDTISGGDVNKFLENLLLVISGDGRGLGPVMDDLNKIIGTAAAHDDLLKLMFDNLNSVVNQFAGKSPMIIAMVDKLGESLGFVHEKISIVDELLVRGSKGLPALVPLLEQIVAIYDDNFPGVEGLVTKFVPSVAISVLQQSLASVPMVIRKMNDEFLVRPIGQNWSCRGSLPIPTSVLLGVDRVEICK